MQKYFILIIEIIFFFSLNCSKHSPILNFTISGQLTLDDPVLSQQDTLKLDSTDEIRIAAFLRRYYASTSTWKDTLVSNEVQIKYSKNNPVVLNIFTEGIPLELFDHIYILGYFHQESNPFAFKNYVRSMDACPVFKGCAAAFVYSDGKTLFGFDPDQVGWSIESDSSGHSSIINSDNFTGALLTVHFY